MKRWLLLLSIALLSNGLNAMEKAQEQDEDWVNVDDDADDDTDVVNDDLGQLVEDLIAIKERAEWPEEELDLGIQIHGIFTYDADYPNPHTFPTIITALNRMPSTADPATLPVPSALVAAVSNNSAPSTGVSTVITEKPSAAARASLPTSNSTGVPATLYARKKQKKPRRAIIKSPPASDQSSPIVAPFGFGASISAYMTSSISSSSSIVTSIDEDQGISYCRDGVVESDDEPDNKKNGKQKQKKQVQKNEPPVEGLDPADFALGIFGYMLGIETSGK
jgi:hypothetical protein